MNSLSLTKLTRKAIWLIIAALFMVMLIFQLFGAVIRRPTTTTGSTACGRTVSQSTSPYSSYLENAVMAPEYRYRIAAATTGDDEVSTVELQSDILLYPAVIIAAEGHKVKITGQTTYQAGSSAMTKVWIDENDNGIEEESECIEELSSFMSSVYLYGGSDSLATTCNSISITMEGGEIGAIFAGGYYQNVTTNSVDIKILGGSVHYVDCGSHVGPLNEKLTAGSISVLLQDCRYRSNFPVSFLNKNSYKCNDVTVRDLADHRNSHSYTWVKPVFNNYISQISKNRYIFGGHVTIPADCNIKAQKLVLEGAEVNNLGTVAISSCADIHMLDSAIWTGNDIETTHTEGSVVSYDYKSHTRQCSTCGQNICRDHIWTYPETIVTTDVHVKKCAVCNYYYTEHCTQKTIYNHSLIKEQECIYCGVYQIDENHTNSYNPTCQHSLRNTASITRYHAELLPESLLEYSINHTAVYCANSACKAMLPFTMVYNGSYYYFRGLTEVSQFIKKKSIATANVTMNCDAFSQNDYSTLDSIYTNGTINLDMNGCDMMNRKVIFHSGTINVTNSKFDTNHYALLSGSNCVLSSNATVSVQGCCMVEIDVNENSSQLTLSDVLVNNCTIRDVSKVTIDVEKEGSVIFMNYVHFEPSADNFLPNKYIIKEYVGNGAWIRRYDHFSEIPNWMGPMGNSSGYVAVMPCTLHKLTSAKSYNATLHIGSCDYCRRAVALGHDWSSGSYHSDSLHYAKCSLCKYKSTKDLRNHDYDSDGKCSVEGCGHVSPVSVHGHYSASKTYFNNFDDAFDAANAAGMYDTITLHSDVANNKVHKLSCMRLYTNLSAITPIKNGSIGSRNQTKQSRYVGPFIHIAGQKNMLTLNKAITIPTELTESKVYAYEMSGDTSKFTTTFIHPTATQLEALKVIAANAPKFAPGYVIKTISSPLSIGYYPCPHTKVTHAQVKDANGNLMAYHSRTCDTCGETWYWDHKYTNNVCDTCSVSYSNTIAVRVTWPGKAEPMPFQTLKAAWNTACRLSQENNITCTIQVLKDISLNSESTTRDSLYIQYAHRNADIVLDATDDEGREHVIKGWGNAGLRAADRYGTEAMINLNYGHLTIKSGIYQGYKYGIKTNDRNHLTLEGGTFKNGLLSTASVIYDALYCTGSTNATRGILPCLADGYVLVVKQKSNGYSTIDGTYSKWLRNYRSGNISANILYGTYNGEVIRCPHPAGTMVDYKAPTCFATGNPNYFNCFVCCPYTSVVSSIPTTEYPSLDKLAHSYDSNSKCVHCGCLDGDALYQKYKANGTLESQIYFTGFIDAWRKVTTESTNNDGASYVIKMFDDETMPEGFSLTNSYFPKKNITINLNGHHLDLQKGLLHISADLSIVDATQNGSLVCRGISRENATCCLTLDGVQFKADHLVTDNLCMVNGAGICFDGGTADDAFIHLKNVTMENGCWMEGDGCSSFELYGVPSGSSFEYDLDEAIVDLNHTLKIKQQDCNGDWIDAEGSNNSFVFNRFVDNVNGKRTIAVVHKFSSYNQSDAGTCYRWRAVKEDVEHSITSTGTYCNYCRFNTQHYMLFDDTQHSASSGHQYKGVGYSRNFSTPNVWEAMYVPMSLDVESCKDECDIAEIYSFGRLCDTNGDGQLTEADDTWLIVDKMTSGATEANYPYLVRPKTTGRKKLVSADAYLSEKVENRVSCANSHTKYTFIGTNISTIVNQADTYFALNNQGVMNVLANKATIKAQRWYMYPTANGSGYATALKSAQANGIRVMVIGEDLTEETAIQLLQGESVEVNLDGQRFTLDGRKANNTQSGLQILNGKTIMIK